MEKRIKFEIFTGDDHEDDKQETQRREFCHFELIMWYSVLYALIYRALGNLIPYLFFHQGRECICHGMLYKFTLNYKFVPRDP